MSFSSRVKDELSRQVPAARHCQTAETAVILSLYGHVKISVSDHSTIEIRTEDVVVARKYSTLLKKTFNTSTDALARRGGNPSQDRTYIVAVREHNDALKVLQAAKPTDGQGGARGNLSLVRSMVVQNVYCRRAFIGGAFLAPGFISDPEKFYHFEITCSSMVKAKQPKGIIAALDMGPKIVLRKKYCVAYIKGENQVVDIFNVMEVPVPLVGFENICILREMWGNVNHQVNCKTANINKTVSTTVKQTEDIRYIQDTIGPEGLPKGFRDMTRIRLECLEATLKELGGALEPPVGKSGVNHRPRKLSRTVDDTRQWLSGKQYGVHSSMYH